MKNKIIISFIVIAFSGCASLDQSIFETYNQSVNISLETLEAQMTEIEQLGQELFALEATLGNQDLLDAELIRNGPYKIEYENSPFFLTVRNSLNSIKEFNDFYRSYSSIMFSIASDDLNNQEAIVSYNNSIQKIADDLGLSGDVMSYSITGSSMILNTVLERVTYKQELESLQEITEITSPVIIDMIDVYIEIVDTLEFTLSDYYSRYMLSLESLGLLIPDNLEYRENLSRRTLSLSEKYRNSISTLGNLRVSFERLRSLEIELSTRILEEDFEKEELRDFVMRNYEFYEELES